MARPNDPQRKHSAVHGCFLAVICLTRLALSGGTALAADTGLILSDPGSAGSSAIERGVQELDQQRRDIAAELARADAEAQAQLQRELDLSREQLDPPGLSIVAPPAPEGKEVFSIRADSVPFRSLLVCLARKARIALKVSASVGRKSLDEPVTADIRFASLDEALEMLCGMLDLAYRIGRAENGILDVLISAPAYGTDPADRGHILRQKALSLYTYFVLKYSDDATCADAYYRMGEILFDQKEYALAAQDYKLMLERDPKNTNASAALVKMGRCYSELGDYATASKVLYSYLDSAPDPAGASQALLAIGRVAARAGENEEALRAYGRLLLEFPNAGVGPRAQHEAADLLFNGREYEKALNQYASLRKSRPDYEPRTVPYRAALCKMKLEQWQAAAADFAALAGASTRDGVSVQSYYKLAQCLDARGATLEALEAYIGATSRFSDDTAAPAARARIIELCREVGLIDRAVLFGERALKQTEPGEGLRLIKYQLALAARDAGQFARARQLFEELAQTDGPGLSKAEALVGAADVSRKLGENDKAEVLYRGALDAGPTAGLRRRALRGLADTLVARGDYAEAAAAYQGVQDLEDDQ